ncbi:OsmC family protein [Aeromicrobium ginsengisoli]|uniref:OsmC family protein n=1 Tax=Aeromicrobium ginsengisoli TaxID=363867 RepID=A0A5M4F9D3_9ACTN|nr:OsmC family protein [Aeromicrobium ginsengisoli]KAA1394362.1 OsmC family protein [Aeromicrobium ginsengisoli]
MTAITATFRTIPGTQAAEGRTGEHAVVVDRPAGVAGGAGAGMNGGQLLALAIGGCLANDVRYVAAVRNDTIDDVQVDVSLEIDNGLVTSADVVIRLVVPDGVDTAALVDEAVAASTVLAAVRDGFPVTVR